MPLHIEIPEPLRQRHRMTPEGRSWLGSVHAYIAQALEQWHLTLHLPANGVPWYGHTGVVLPVSTAQGAAAALKVAFPYDEAILEPHALALWNGSGAVPLLESDETIGALLIERLDNKRSLRELPMEEAIAQWGEVVQGLNIRPDDRPQWSVIPHIAGTAEQYSDELPQRWTDLGEPFPRWLLEAALETCQLRGAVGRRSSNDVLVHTDLHYENVLAQLGTGHYLAIDPQAQVGDAEFAVAPCLWNRLEDLPTINTEAGLRRRSSELARAAGLDEALSAQWAVLREVENALCYFEEQLHDDAQRSLWVASTMAGKTMPNLPDAHELKRLY